MLLDNLPVMQTSTCGFVTHVLGCGLIPWAVRLPPLIGFLVAGFALHAAGVEHVAALDLFSDIGVTLMLFAIGLRLDLKALTDECVISSVAMYREDVEDLEALGLNVVVHIQDGAGESLAERTFIENRHRQLKAE